jgi:hypothetical protein
VRDGIAQTAGITVISGLVIVTPPAAPTLAAPTGNAAATTINWATGEAGCTYTVYFSDIDTPINLGNFALPAPITTGVDATSQVLPAIVGYPGRVRVLVRATKGGVEEKNGDEQVIEYDSVGAIVGDRPNRASVQDVTTNGLTLTVKAVIDSLEADADATHLDLYVKDVGTPFVLGTPEASESLSAAVDNVQVKEISYAVAYPGFYHFEVRARTAGGIRSAFATERFIHLENAAPGLGPDNADVIVSRGDRT